MKLDDVKIPETIEQTFFVCINLNPESYELGVVKISTVPYHQWAERGDDGYAGWKLITEKTIKIKLPKVKLDARGEMVKSLEAEKKKVMAEYTKRLNQINDRIQKLQAIEYKESA